MSTEQQGPQGAETPEVVTIIRYPNRRLYDRSRGRYVTLQDVEDTVRSGGTVLVRDSKTGADLTRVLLTQIILERHPERMELFPLSLLHLIIRTEGALFGFLRDTVRQALLCVEMFQRAIPFSPLLPPQEWLRSFLPSSFARGSSEPDINALQGRIAELERRLDELRSSREGQKKKSEKRRSSPEDVGE